MRADGKAEVQHYVPQLLLRFHAYECSKKGSEQVWCFDKLTSKIFPVNVKGVLAGTRFYEVKLEEGTTTLEPALTDLENRVTPVLTRLLGGRSVAILTAEERQTIADFCAAQLIRTQAFRDQIKDINVGVAEALKKRGIDPTQVRNFEMLSEADIKKFSLEILADAPARYGPYFLDKHWYLIEASPADPFQIGDNPVTLDNDFAQGLGTHGLASPGISIYLPISPLLCLGMVDPRLVAMLMEKAKLFHQRYRRFKNMVPRRRRTKQQVEILQMMKKQGKEIENQLKCFTHGIPWKYDAHAVTRVNSLQMLYANRWIVSSNSEFSLPKQMIADDENFRNRRMLQVE